MIRQQYWDQDGQLTGNHSGYAVLVRTYDDFNRLTEECYLNSENQLTNNQAGYAKIWREYDGWSMIRETKLDQEGNVTEISNQ